MLLGDLLAETHRRLGDAVEIDYEKLATEFIRCHCDGILELIAFEPALTVQPSDRPTAFAVARLQAQGGGEVVNLRHRLVALNDLERLSMSLLDGTRDRDELLDAMSRIVREKRFHVQEDGQRLPDQASVRQALARALDASLSRFAANALLIA